MKKKLFEYSGMSLVELLVAVALLGMISVAALQFIQVNEQSMFGEQTQLTNQQQSEAIAAHIYKKFSSRTLAEPVGPQVYSDAELPQDLQDGDGMTLVALFGNISRFDGIDPRCTLAANANVSAGTFQMKHDCMTRGGDSIAKLMNALIAKGVVLTLGIEDGVGRCSISRPIFINQSTGIATINVDDPACLADGVNPSRGVTTGKQVLLPRFVAYDTASPGRFHTSMIEPPDLSTPGIGLEMPDEYAVVGHGGLNVVSFVDALANDPMTDVFLELKTDVATSKLSLPNAPGTVRLVGENSRKLSLEGPVKDVRLALQKLEYRSPSGYMGEDKLYGKMRSGSLIQSDNTTLNVAVNCGGQRCGTGTRFDLGEFDASTGKFTVRQYITSVSICGNELPSTYYGYCGTKFKFDREDGLERRYPNGDSTGECALASKVSYGDINNLKQDGYPYVYFSPKSRWREHPGIQYPDHVTVFLYEQTSTSLPAADVARLKPTTENRFSLFFQFDSYDDSYGSVAFTLNNIEKDRVLSDRTDPFTFLDDTTEFFPKVHPDTGQLLSKEQLEAAKLSPKLPTKIGGDGTLSSSVDWKKPSDGIVVPLRLSPSALNAATNLYELRHYNHDPDGDGVVDPNLQMQSWSGLDGWNIRATADDGKSVIFKRVNFNDSSTGRQADIQLKISGSQPCS
ncbi:PilW family protein [Alphaproteobacteria bacterium LSUCC0719]